MSQQFKATGSYSGPQGLSAPVPSVLKQALLDMPELVHWFSADTRAPSASRLSFRDVATGDLIQGYGTTKIGAGINGAPTALFDNTAQSRLLAPWQLTPSYSVIAMYRISALPTTPAVFPLLSDDAGLSSGTPEFIWGPNNLPDNLSLKHQNTGTGSHVVDPVTLSLNTNYISYGSFDNATLQAGVGTNKYTPAATATLNVGYDGANRLWIGGGIGSATYTFAGEISDIITLNVPIHEAAYQVQRANVLNFLAAKGAITLAA
jgi:hypothetical protein